MIAFIWKLILGGLWKPLLAVLGALGLYFKGRSDAKAKVIAKQNEATLEAIARAGEGAQDATDKLAKGATPAEIKAANDKRWRK